MWHMKEKLIPCSIFPVLQNIEIRFLEYGWIWIYQQKLYWVEEMTIWNHQGKINPR